VGPDPQSSYSMVCDADPKKFLTVVVTGLQGANQILSNSHPLVARPKQDELVTPGARVKYGGPPEVARIVGDGEVSSLWLDFGHLLPSSNLRYVFFQPGQ